MKRPAVSPYLLLVLTTLFWAGNSILGRFVRLDVPPVGLSFWRWTLAGALLLPFVWRGMIEAWPLVRQHVSLVIALSVLGVSCFNSFLYIGLQTTTASNSVLLLSVTPLMIMLISWQLLDVSVTRLQLLGIAVSLTGVVVIVSKASFTGLIDLAVVRGDFWVLAAVFSWALYSVLLRLRPAGLGGLTLLGYTVVIGLIGILPFYLIETLAGRPMVLSTISVLSVAYVAVFASLLAYLFWNHAVSEVGANRAGLFIHLIPLFGSLMSVLFLGERLHLYHLGGILLIGAGIAVATFSSGRRGN